MKNKNYESNIINDYTVIRKSLDITVIIKLLDIIDNAKDEFIRDLAVAAITDLNDTDQRIDILNYIQN